MLVVAAVSLAAGFAASDPFLRAQLGYSLDLTKPSYFASLAGELVLSLAIIGATFLLLRRITGPERRGTSNHSIEAFRAEG
jgi:nitrate reductase gamma subunit